MGGHTLHGPNFLAHVLLPSALHLDLGSSVQCSIVGLCLYLRPSLDDFSDDSIGKNSKRKTESSLHLKIVVIINYPKCVGYLKTELRLKCVSHTLYEGNDHSIWSNFT